MMCNECEKERVSPRLEVSEKEPKCNNASGHELDTVVEGKRITARCIHCHWDAYAREVK